MLPIKNGIPVRSGDVDSFHGDLIYTYIFYGRKKRNLVKNILSVRLEYQLNKRCKPYLEEETK